MREHKISVNGQEKNLLDLIRLIAFGEIKIIVQNSRPIRVEELKKSIKL